MQKEITHLFILRRDGATIIEKTMKKNSRKSKCRKEKKSYHRKEKTITHLFIFRRDGATVIEKTMKKKIVEKRNRRKWHHRKDYEKKWGLLTFSFLGGMVPLS